MSLIKHTLLITSVLLSLCSYPLFAQHHSTGSVHGGTIIFPKGSAELTNGAKQQLPQLIYEMLLYKRSKVAITGCGDKSKAQITLSQKRVDAVVQYMEWYGIAKDRLVIQYGQAGNPDVVTYSMAQQGHGKPNNTEPPKAEHQHNDTEQQTQ